MFPVPRSGTSWRLRPIAVPFMAWFGSVSMKTILLSTAAFSIAGAVGGYFYKAVMLPDTHAHGMPLPLQDWLYDSIYAAIFGVIGCFIGLLLGLTLHRLTGCSKLQSASY